MSIKILSADEIKQKKNSYDIPPVLFANPMLQMLWKAN